MPRYRSRFVTLLSLLVLVCAAAFSGCGDDEGSDADDSETPAAAFLSDCTPETLETVQEGKLTIATDSPALEPYFVDDEPTNGQGFESAVAYAVADRLGFEQADVTWTVVPREAIEAPGEKDFDFALNQVAITAERTALVDFSSAYYEVPEGIVVLEDSEVAETIEDVDDLKGLDIGVPGGTIAVDTVDHEIAPDNEPQVFDVANDALTALEQGQVDAVVIDVPTAFYLTEFEIPEATLAGQLEAHADEVTSPVQWGAVLEKGSPLTECVSAAILDLRSSGELAEIEHEWMSDAVDVPVLEDDH